MSTQRRMLVVSHESTLTGAPMNLLHFVRWMVENTAVDVHTLLLRDGTLHGRFAEVSKVTALDGPAWRELFDHHAAPTARLLPRLQGKTLGGSWARRQVEHLTDFDLVYLNGVASTTILPYLPDNPPVLCHVHEMGVALKSLSPSQRQLLQHRPSMWIAASAAVRDDLVQELGIDVDRIHVHHEFIDARALASTRIDQRSLERLRRQQEIPQEAAIVMGAGTLEWRKGCDLFVQLAVEVSRRTREPIRFVWVGGDLSSADWMRLWSDCGRAGVRDLVRFVGTVPDPAKWFATSDVFVLTSHEDPYPLVCLEQAAIGHPVVSFRNGGMVELLEPAGPESAACVIAHLDIAGMADRVLALLDSDDLRTTVGSQLQHRVLEQHDVSVAAPLLWQRIEDLLP